MASRPDIDTGQLEKADRLLSDIVSKFDTLARFDELPVFNLIKRDIDDIDKKLDAMTKVVGLFSKKGAKSFKEYAEQIKKTKNRINDINKEMRIMEKHYGKSEKDLEKQNLTYRRLREELARLNKEQKEQLDLWKAMAKLSGQEGMRFLDWFGGSVASLTFSSVFAGFKLLATGIERVYDLQEKWTHAIGTFRKAIGPATKESSIFEKHAASMQGQLYGLGMGFDAAHTEMANFVKGFGFANDEAAKWAKDSIKFGVVTGAGTEAIAELSRNMMLMGMEQKKQHGYFTEMIGAANAAGVSVSDFSKEIAGAKDSLAEFGESGQKSFMTAASWARKLGVSIKSLQNIIKLTDTFESTAQAAAKMNTVFGTSINSLDLMLEQDPAKRFNIIRDAMIGAGKDMKNLSRLEKKLLADTLQMSVEEVNAFLTSGKSYEKFMEDKAKQDREAARNTANINKLMGKAATTMLEWGNIAQQVIRKFQPFIDRFLKGMGFEGIADGAQKFGKSIVDMAGKISDVMTKNGMLKTFENLGKSAMKVFTEILDPKNIEKTVKGISELFTKFSGLISKIAEFAAGPGGKFVSELIEFVGKHAGLLAAIWGTAKVGKGVFDIAGALGGGGGGAVLGALGKAGAVGAAGAGAYGLTDLLVNKAEVGGLSIGDRLQYGIASLAGNRGVMDQINAKQSRHRASGGPVSAHQPYTVGEVGPELFVPSTSGMIVPNGGGSGFLPVTNVLHVHLDSREIQRIPFNTALPVHVAAVGA